MDKTVNVAVVTLPFHEFAGEAILSNYLDLLEPLANEIFIITGKLSKRLNQKIHIIRVGADIDRKEPILVKSPRFLLTQLKYCYHLFKISRNIEVVIFQIGTRLYLLPMFLAKLLGKKVLIINTGLQSVHAEANYAETWLGFGKIFFPFIFRLIERAGFFLADHIAALSENGISSCGLDRYREKSTISGAQYIDTKVFRIKKAFEDRRNLVGYLGRLTLAKGVMNLVEAIPLILAHKNELEFLIAGNGSLRDKINHELERKNLYSKVKLTDWIPQDKLPEQLNDLRFLILPSRMEGLPAIIQQAMACGVVVLATPVGGTPDLVKNEETGFILDNDSPGCIAKTVIKALEHPELIKISQNARRLIEREYNYEVSLRKCEKTLCSTLMRN